MVEKMQGSTKSISESAIGMGLTISGHSNIVLNNHGVSEVKIETIIVLSVEPNFISFMRTHSQSNFITEEKMLQSEHFTIELRDMLLRYNVLQHKIHVFNNYCKYYY